MSTGKRCWTLGLALLAGACNQTGTPAQPSTSELSQYCAIASRDDLSTWVGDLLTLCQADGSGGATCKAARPKSNGVAPVTLHTSPLRALPASGGKLVVLGSDSRLTLVKPDGSEERELAHWASDPWISPDGERVVWIGLPEGVTQWEDGVETVVVAQDLSSQSGPTVLAHDGLASTPRPVPGSKDVLYVSAQTGLASFWIVGPSRSPEQLTNIGQTDIGQATVPVADHELVWSDGVLYYSVPDSDTGPHLWRFDVATSQASEVGPGAWPRLHSSSIIALDSGSAACAAVYTNGGNP